jgi:hypothetical protein
MEKAEALSDEIQNMKNYIYELEKSIVEKIIELKHTCPHEKKRRQYDDDYYKPHWYYKCITCDKEFHIKYK